MASEFNLENTILDLLSIENERLIELEIVDISNSLQLIRDLIINIKFDLPDNFIIYLQQELKPELQKIDRNLYQNIKQVILLIIELKDETDKKINLMNDLVNKLLLLQAKTIFNTLREKCIDIPDNSAQIKELEDKLKKDEENKETIQKILKQEEEKQEKRKNLIEQLTIMIANLSDKIDTMSNTADRTFKTSKKIEQQTQPEEQISQPEALADQEQTPQPEEQTQQPEEQTQPEKQISQPKPIPEPLGDEVIQEGGGQNLLRQLKYYKHKYNKYKTRYYNMKNK
jgi:hypothetical protein